MRKLLIFSMILILWSCNNQGTVTQEKIDSLNEKIDTSLDKAWDSTKAKAKELRDKVKEEWNESRDSSNKKDTVN